MGNDSIIDLEKREQILRCNQVKLAIIWVNLIGPPISLIFLIFSILRMILIKKRKTFLTSIIILIFASEIIQCLSKLLQILKYSFKNERNDKTIKDRDTPRGIICQIQITSAIFSDLCSLLGTLLLSFRCYDVIKNKNRLFDKKLHGILSVIIVIVFSAIVSISFLFIDRKVTKGNISYRYDLRDRCSYWCWLEHIPSFCCLPLYWLILIFNIYFACKTNSYLKMGYTKLIEASKVIVEQKDDLKDSFNGETEDNDTPENKNSQSKEKKEKLIILSNEEKERIEQLKLMRIKCLIYPCVTIVYWLFAATYRIIDDTVMIDYDTGDPQRGADKEREDFQNHPFFHFIVQFFLFTYTLFSSIRGILYGFSFIVFEEKIFFDFFKRCFKKFYKETELEKEEESARNTRNTRNINSISSNSEKSKEIQKEEDNEENN